LKYRDARDGAQDFQHSAESYPNANAPVIELQATAKGSTQASASAWMSGPKNALMRCCNASNSSGVSSARRGSSTRNTCASVKWRASR
jgi:hypothetical protein